MIINKTIAIAALARNCETNLPNNIKRIEQLRKYFEASYIFIYENNSTDTTKEILSNWQSRSENVYLMMEDLEDNIKKENINIGKMYKGASLPRIKRMCEARNKLLNMIKESCTPDYVMFLDSDVYAFSVEGVVRAIQTAPSKWGALFANCYIQYVYKGAIYNTPLYYDTYPYIDKGRKASDVSYKEFHSIRRFFLAKRLYRDVQKCVFYECESAFGGTGIYQYKSIVNNKYDIFMSDEMKPSGLCLSEHVFLNSQIKEARYIAQDVRVIYNVYRKSGIKGFLYHYFTKIYNLVGILTRFFAK